MHVHRRPPPCDGDGGEREWIPDARAPRHRRRAVHRRAADDHGGAIYVRASFGEIEHITAVHPLVENTRRTLLLVSTHAGFSERVEFFRDTLGDSAGTDVLCRALLDSTAMIGEA